MLDQANEHIHRSGIYRVGRLNAPGDITIVYTPGRAGRYHLTVRNDRGQVTRSLAGLEISHAILDLLAIWEEEPDDEGPSFVS